MKERAPLFGEKTHLFRGRGDAHSIAFGVILDTTHLHDDCVIHIFHMKAKIGDLAEAFNEVHVSFEKEVFAVGDSHVFGAFTEMALRA